MTDLDSCFDMRKGNLILRGIVNQDLSGDSLPYLTGGVYTCGKKLFSEGRIEVCAKLNAARGAWPAIWMLPEDGEWVQGGEIDIMERLNYDHFLFTRLFIRIIRNIRVLRTTLLLPRPDR